MDFAVIVDDVSESLSARTGLENSMSRADGQLSRQ